MTNEASWYIQNIDCILNDIVYVLMINVRLGTPKYGKRERCNSFAFVLVELDVVQCCALLAYGLLARIYNYICKKQGCKR